LWWCAGLCSTHSIGIDRLPTSLSELMLCYTLLNNIQPIGTEQSLTINSQCLTQRWKKKRKEKKKENNRRMQPVISVSRSTYIRSQLFCWMGRCMRRGEEEVYIGAHTRLDYMSRSIPRRFPRSSQNRNKYHWLFFFFLFFIF
jgi:hypothetical protein